MKQPAQTVVRRFNYLNIFVNIFPPQATPRLAGDRPAAVDDSREPDSHLPELMAPAGGRRRLSPPA